MIPFSSGNFRTQRNSICSKQSTWVQGTWKLSRSTGIYSEHTECPLFLPLGRPWDGPRTTRQVATASSGSFLISIPRSQTWPDFWGSRPKTRESSRSGPHRAQQRAVSPSPLSGYLKTRRWVFQFPSTMTWFLETCILEVVPYSRNVTQQHDV